MEGDQLRSVRNAYYLGLYADVEKECKAIEQTNREAIGKQSAK
jgi:hypothetical protein